MKAVVTIAVVCAIIALLVLVTQMLWNVLLPELFGFPIISFWQASGLVLLGRLLFAASAGK